MLEIWIDGTSKPDRISNRKQAKVGHSAIAVIVKKDGKVIHTESKYVGVLDNNQAEYEAFVCALNIALDMDVKFVKFYTDSNLLEKQMNFKYNCHSEAIAPYYMKSKNLLHLLPCWEVKWISRKENREADKMADQAIEMWKTEQFKDI
ncbi:MAG: hypothetical protein K0R18_129 [Bacillales bacterium]|jgi:probable phosphoglycerate mutase|nr:hypothetical protein [Bacillales bacterium]